jgi:hypothetical protein
MRPEISTVTEWINRHSGILSQPSRFKFMAVFKLFSLFEKTKGRLVGSPWCLCVRLCVSPPHKLLNASPNLYETWYVYHGIWAHLKGMFHKSFHTSLCLYLYLPIVGRQRLVKYVPVATNTSKNIRILVDVVFYTVCVLSKESLWVCLRILCSVLVFIALVVVWRLPELSDSKISPVRLETENHCAAEASSNLLDWNGLCVPPSLIGNGSVNAFSN